MAPPDLAAARRAADEIAAAGVGRVLLFGSLARGEAQADSDIDLVAIYDDLDYAERSTRRCRLESRAHRAAGCPVDVYVTDAPEWARRTTQVPCSLEAHIVNEAIELADTGSHTGVKWEKEIGLPADITGELQHRFTDMTSGIFHLTGRLRPTQDEADAAAEGDRDEVAACENYRFAAAMGDIHMIAEAAAKASHILFVGTTPAHTHEIARLLDSLPNHVRRTFRDHAGTQVDLDALHLWRQGATYSADRPEPRFNERYLRTHAQAALDIAGFVADQCRQHGLPDPVLAHFDLRTRRCTAALDQPVRHQGID